MTMVFCHILHVKFNVILSHSRQSFQLAHISILFHIDLTLLEEFFNKLTSITSNTLLTKEIDLRCAFARRYDGWIKFQQIISCDWTVFQSLKVFESWSVNLSRENCSWARARDFSHSSVHWTRVLIVLKSTDATICLEWQELNIFCVNEYISFQLLEQFAGYNNRSEIFCELEERLNKRIMIKKFVLNVETMDHKPQMGKITQIFSQEFSWSLSWEGRQRGDIEIRLACYMLSLHPFNRAVRIVQYQIEIYILYRCRDQIHWFERRTRAPFPLPLR